MPIRNFNQKAVKIIWSCRQTSAHAAVTRKLTCKVAPLQASEDLTHVQRAEPSSQPTVLCGGTSLNPVGVREEKLQCYSKSQQSVRLQMTGGWGVCRRRFGVGGAQVRFQGQQLLPEVTPRRHSFCAVMFFNEVFQANGRMAKAQPIHRRAYSMPPCWYLFSNLSRSMSARSSSSNFCSD